MVSYEVCKTHISERLAKHKKKKKCLGDFYCVIFKSEHDCCISPENNPLLEIIVL